MGGTVLRGESYKGLAPPGSTTNREQLQSTQMAADRHHLQTKHRTPSQKQSTCQAAYYPSRAKRAARWQ